ncbi:ABC-2 type transport system permease protein [Lactobacillus bombicola]|uniref:ABC-2 type transport system permease protein n=2 Tax=Lactobacillus TaxID=1578 RepID=A0A1I1RSP9_9LACO|nr:ABC-2 family transporter protein [Lactobacillus bombicola]SFD35228.1 ABC-2 type transport system permease protein [Lactobacillus bombicola]
MKKIKKYMPILYLGMKDNLVFRSNIILTIILQVANLAVSLWIWNLLLPHSDFINMARYLILTNTTTLIFTTTPLYYLAGLISSGRLSMYITKPISLFWYIFLYSFGRQFYILIFYLVLLVILSNNFIIVVFLFFYFIVANFMFFNLMLLLGELSFWIINMWPLRNGINAIYLLLGGLYFPLNMLDKRIYSWLQYNPFSLVTDVPARLIISGGNTNAIIKYFFVVFLWLVGFNFLRKYIFKIGIKKYEGVGA